MSKRILSLSLAVLLVLCCFPIAALAADPMTILAIGDSITAGYGLKSKDSESFSAIFAAEGYTVINKGVNGNTVTGLSKQLADGAISNEEIAAADIITITCGGNDLMALLYQKIADRWNSNNPNDPIAADEITAEMSDPSSSRRTSLMISSLHLLDSKNSLYMIDDPDFLAALAAYAEGLKGVVESLKTINPDMKVFVATQYNPYIDFKNARYMSYISIDPVYSGFEAGVALLNDAIRANAAEVGYTVADVKVACDTYEGDETELYNASSFTMDLDFHPSATGHALIAEVFLSAFEAAVTVPAEDPCKGDESCPMSVFDDLNPQLWYHDGIHYCIENILMQGVSATEFAPSATATRAMIITTLWRLDGCPVIDFEMNFADVAEGKWYTEAIRWAAGKGIVNGYGNGLFGVSDPITREQLAKILCSYAEYAGAKDDTTAALSAFADADTVSNWAKDAMQWAVGSGLINGKNGNQLAPKANATRAEAAAMLYRYCSSITQ